MVISSSWGSSAVWTGRFRTRDDRRGATSSAAAAVLASEDKPFSEEGADDLREEGSDLREGGAIST